MDIYFYVGLVIIDDPWCELEFAQLFYIKIILIWYFLL